MEWLETQYQLHKDREFLNHLTFGDVYERVQTVAAKLAGAVSAVSSEPNSVVTVDGVGGARPDGAYFMIGDIAPMNHRVGLLWDNSVDMAIYVLALLSLKQQIVMINTHLRTAEIEKQLAQLDVRIVVCSNEREQQVPKVLTRADTALDKTSTVHEKIKIQVWTEQFIESLPPIAVNLDKTVQDSDIAVIMNTSATTGSFKSVPLRWEQIKAHMAASKQVLCSYDHDRWLMVLPLFHVSGFSILMRSLYNGTAVEIMGKYDEAQVAKLIETGAVNMVSLVPTILSSLVKRINTHHMRVILLGGEYIPLELVKVCKEKSLPIYKTYGMTETFSQSVTFSVLDHEDKIDSVGLPLPGMEIYIVNPDADGIGEIHLRGPMLMSGYIGREPITGAFNTDDIGYVDDDGYVYVLNRRKDIIISGGENIYPKEIEDALYELPYVKECAVVPVADEKWGQVPALFVALQEVGNEASGKTPTEDKQAENIQTESTQAEYPYIELQLLQFLRSRFATYKIPKYIRILPELPRNGTGKILRKDLHI